MSVSSTRVGALQTGAEVAGYAQCPGHNTPSRTLCNGRMSLSLLERISFLIVPKSC